MIVSLCKFYNTNGGMENVSKNINSILLKNNFSVTVIYFGLKNQIKKKKKYHFNRE